MLRRSEDVQGPQDVRRVVDEFRGVALDGEFTVEALGAAARRRRCTEKWLVDRWDPVADDLPPAKEYPRIAAEVAHATLALRTSEAIRVSLLAAADAGAVSRDDAAHLLCAFERAVAFSRSGGKAGFS